MSDPSTMITEQDPLAKIKAPIEHSLVLVDEALAHVLSTPVELIPAVQRHAIGPQTGAGAPHSPGALPPGGGKKIRPALLLLSARVAATTDAPPSLDEEGLVQFAAACETIHLASLIHDDVADGAAVRRGHPTANQRWRNKICVFAADYLFASIYSTLSTPEWAGWLRRLSQAVNRMCEGEVVQAAAEGNPEVTEEEYMRIIRGKTAALMSVACEIGALMAGASADLAACLARFGEHFGMAFQITDDLLDLHGREEEMGKRPGSDVRNGRFTLPVIRLRDGLTGRARDELVHLLARHSSLSDDEIAGLRQWLEVSGALASAWSSAQDYVVRARSCLAGLPASEAREALETLCQFLLERRQ